MHRPERTAPLQCSTCHQQFSRPEHLRRHGQVHAQNKPYRCAHCDKSFARKDAAKRHETVHKPLNAHSGQVKLRQSCSACAMSRVKCSGGKPCSRCTSKNLQCTYSPRKSHRFPPVVVRDDIPSSANSVSDDGGLDEASGGESVEDSTPNQNGPNSASTAVNNAGENLGYTEPVDTPSNPGRIPQSPPSSSRRPINWLPFQNLGHETFARFLFTDQVQYDQNLNAAPWTSPQAAETSGDGRSGTGGSPSLRYNSISALITSMSAGLPGLPQTSDKGRPLDSEPLGFASRYADGAGARSSQANLHMLERQRMHSVIGAAIDASRNADSSWIEILRSKVRSCSGDGTVQFYLPDLVYQDILLRIEPLQSRTPSMGFSSSWGSLIRKESLELFIQLYFQNFHSLYPFLDPSLLSIPVWGWSLCLATAAIGARFIAAPDITTFGDNLCNLLNDIISKEIDLGSSEDSLPYIQARILTTIGMCLSRNNVVMDKGYNAITLVSNACLRLRLLDEDDSIGAYNPAQSLEQVWIAWRFRETRRRTGLFIWVADCMLSFICQTSPRLPLRMLNLKLPSDDILWEADSCDKWLGPFRSKEPSNRHSERFYSEENSRLSVRETFQMLWTKCSTSKPKGQFGRIVLISMLVQRSWDALWYLNDPIFQTSTGYLAAVPEFAKWRNTTCDCLDTLHWEALSNSIKKGGVEGPIFLHLHLARLTLLTPIRQFFSCIHAKAGGSTSRLLLPHDLYLSPESGEQSLQTILTWVRNDRYKARLAVVHAGAIFWHVRRYSSDSFVQPFAVFLATITLWMYGSYFNYEQPSSDLLASSTSRPNSSIPVEQSSVASAAIAENRATPPVTSPSWDCIEGASSTYSCQNDKHRGSGHGSALPPQYQRMPSYLQLDRPIDDELVQYFIRTEERMGLFLEGVPDLYSADCHDRLLQEGISILEGSAACWTVSHSYAVLLDKLIVHRAT